MNSLLLKASLAICGLSAMAASAQTTTALPAPVRESVPEVAVPGSAGLARHQADWQTLSSQQRREQLARYQAWRALPDNERARLRRAEAEVAALPEDQRKALRARFDAMSRMQREGWRLGPKIGAHYALLHGLIGFVEPAQRDPLLTLLHQLSDSQLEQLAVIAQRTPPQDRAHLIDQLIGMSDQQRSNWFKARSAS